MENKKSFVAYSDWKNIFDELPDEDAGKLIKHIFAYVNDENPISDSILIKAVFANIKTTLKRDLEKWETQLQQRKDAGKLSAQQRATKSNDRSTVVETRQRNPTDNVSVSVSDNVSVRDSLEKKQNNELTINWDVFLSWFNQTTNKKFKTLTTKTKQALNTRLKEGYKKEDIMAAIINCFNDPYHQENPKYLTPEFISRPDKLEKYLNATPKVVSLPANWWDIPLTDEQWAMLPTDKAKEKRLNDLRKKIG